MDDLDAMARSLDQRIGQENPAELILCPALGDVGKDPLIIKLSYDYAWMKGYDVLASLFSGAYAQSEYAQNPQRWVQWTSHGIPYLFREAKGTHENPLKIELEHAPPFIGHHGKDLLIKTTSIQELSFDTDNCVILMPGSAYKDGKKIYALDPFEVEVRNSRKDPQEIFSDLQTLAQKIETLYGPLQEVSTHVVTKGASIHSLQGLRSVTGEVTSLLSRFQSLDGTLEATIINLDAHEERSLQKKHLVAGGIVGTLAATAVALDAVLTGGALTLTSLVLGKKAWDHNRRGKGLCGYGIYLKPIAYGYSTEQIERYKCMQNSLLSGTDLLG